ETFTNNVPPPPDDPPTNGVPTGVVGNAPMLDFPLTAEPTDDSWDGAYAGLFYETNGVNVGRSGYFVAKITDRGTFSGKLTIGNHSSSFSGRFDDAGSARVSVARSGARTLSL